MPTPSRFLTLLLLPALLVLAACDSNEPDPDDGAGDEEVISTVTLTFAPQGGAAAQTFTAEFNTAGVEIDVDRISLVGGTTYDVTIALLNEFASPAEDITLEVRDEEPDAHRFFYVPSSSLDGRLSVSNLDTDPNGDPLGVTFDVTTTSGLPVTGTLTVKLRHYEEDADLPADKQNDTADAPEVPGVVENDLDFEFPVEITS